MNDCQTSTENQINNKQLEDQLAYKVAEKMLSEDKYSQCIGITIVSAKLGEAECQLLLSEQHLNGHGSCHGGVIFSLADTTFAHACNARNMANVGQFCSINYLSPAKNGDVLLAKAIERGVHGRSGVYDITVTNQTGKVIAEFRGQSRQIKDISII